MSKPDRRTFLKLSVLAASAGASRPLHALAHLNPTSPIKAWRTGGKQRFESIEAPAWQSGAPLSAMSIRLDPSQRFQKVLGFGAALTDASCYLLEQADAAKRSAILEECFGKSGLRFSVARTTIGASDYSVSAYSYDESNTPDPDLTHFSIDHDKAYILPLLREARQKNPELYYFSSPWSPPGWMKAGGTLLGGSMRKHYFPAYAQYFVKFLQGYAADGVKIQAVTVQNEVDTDQDGRMPACLWGQEYEIGFVKDHLGPVLRKEGAATKIWVLDHNYNLWGRAIDELSDAGVYEYVDGIAWHGYAGDATAMTRVHEAFPEKNAYWTEGGPDINAPDYETDYAKWAQTFNGVVNNWARSITAWNLALDEKGKPNVGPFSCGGVVTIDNATHKVTRSGQYWAFAHFSRHVRRGAKVVAANGVGETGGQRVAGAISCAAFINPDGSRVAVLANRGPEQRVQLVSGGNALEMDVEADSVHTLKWA